MNRLLRILLLSFLFLHIFSLYSYAQVPTSGSTYKVNATVPPSQGDLEFNLTASVPQGTELGEGEEVTFTITYRSLVSGQLPLKIESYWEEGLVEGSGGSYVDVYEYVVGSATNAHNGSAPVVDIINKKITWNINKIVTSVNSHTVSFKLRVRQNLPTSTRIEVYTKARAEFGTIMIPEQSYQLYAKIDPTVPTLTPISGIPSLTPTKNPSTGGTTNPTSIPGSSSQPTPTPTLFRGRSDIPQFQFITVEVEQLTDEYVQISANLSFSAPLTMNYGVCGEKLSQIISLESEQERHIIDIHNLIPDTSYCFKLKAQDIANKRTIESDIFTFRTASDKEQFKLDKTLITWNNIIVSSGNESKLVTPLLKSIVISFQVENPESIDELKGSFELKNVLGASTMTQSHIEQVNFIEMSPGIFSAEILTPAQKGTYNFMVEIRDVYGSFMRKPLQMGFVVTDPFKVINSQTKKPIENANVMIEKMENSSKRYKSMRQSFFFPYLENGIFLPYRTNERGELDMILPMGKYTVEASAIGYETMPLELSLGIDKLSYPTISLTPRLSIDSYVRYTWNALKTTFAFVPFYTDKFFSTRTILVSALFFQVIFFVMCLILLSIKQRSYNHIQQAGRMSRNIRFFFIQLAKIGIILCIFLSGVLAMLFTIHQNIVSSLPFIVSTLLLVILTVTSKTKPADLE